jgi:hypothetical protein
MSEAKRDPEAANKTLNAFWNCQKGFALNLPRNTEGGLIAVVSAKPEDLIALRRLIGFQMQTLKELMDLGFGLAAEDNLAIAKTNSGFEGVSEAYRRLLLIKKSLDEIFKEIRSRVDVALRDLPK